nr:hypothetical protein [Pandoravirus massiliensis]
MAQPRTSAASGDHCTGTTALCGRGARSSCDICGGTIALHAATGHRRCVSCCRPDSGSAILAPCTFGGARSLYECDPVLGIDGVGNIWSGSDENCIEDDDSDSSDSDTDTDSNDDQDNSSQCGVAPPHTAYTHGYTFIEGFMPADWFDALVRPELRLVLLVCGTPVAVDAAEVERAARVDRWLVTPVGSCRLGPTDAERAHEVDESLYGREGLRRALAPIPLGATLEAVGAPAAEAVGGVGSAILGGILAAFL